MVTVCWVRPDQLGDYKADRLGGGGQGIVYGVPAPLERFPGQCLAYKEYLPVSYDGDALHDLVRFRQAMDPSERAFLDARLTWPLAMVYQGVRPTLPTPSQNPGTTVTGFLMRRVPKEYERQLPGRLEPQPQATEFLLNLDFYADQIGLKADDTQRLELLLDLARTLARLHAHGVAVGDLSPKNVLFTLDEQPRCLLIDCDSMRYRGRDVLDQVDTPGWETPEPEKATVASDSLKFGLIAVRVFNRDQDSRDLTALRDISTELASLAALALTEEPFWRPAVGLWIPALELARRSLKQRQSTADTAPNPNEHRPPTIPPRPLTSPRPAPVWNPSTQQRQPPGSSVRRRAVRALLIALAVAWWGGSVAPQLFQEGATLFRGMGLINSPEATDGPEGTEPSQLQTPSPVATVEATDGTESKPSQLQTPSPAATDGTEETRPDQAHAQAHAQAPGAIVDYSGVSDPWAAEGVADRFASYFGAVNGQDYDTALSYYDSRTGIVDVNSSSSRERWKEAMSTTYYSDLVLTAVDSVVDRDPVHTVATMKFQSHQAAGHGPADSKNDTCDNWTVTYQLTTGGGIYAVPQEEASHDAC